MEKYDSNITGYIKNVRSQMNKISTAYEETDTPLNQFLQAKYEQAKLSPYSNNSFSNLYENSFTKEDSPKEKTFKNKPQDLPARVLELEARISELLKIQDSLIKSLEENKRKALQAEQYDRKVVMELKEKLTFANTKILNLEEALHAGDREKMRRYIKELESCKEALKNENSHLIIKMQDINKDLEHIEIQSKSMSDEMHSLKHQNNSLHNDLVSIKTEKIELLKQIDGLNSQLASKDSAIQDLFNRLEDLKSLIQSTSFQKFSGLSSFQVNNQLETLTRENENLKTLISQKPTNSDIQTAKKKIDKLEKVVDSLNVSSTVDRSKSCEKNKNLASLASQNKILRELTVQLGAASPFELIETFKKVSQRNKVLVKSQEFVEKIKKFLVGAGVEEFLTLKKLWKWIKGMMGEYFELKKMALVWEGTGKQMAKVKSLLGNDCEDVSAVLSRVLVENEYLKLVVNKAKVVLRVGRKIGLQEFENELDSRL
jgi:chromosome segregation ATPase